MFATAPSEVHFDEPIKHSRRRGTKTIDRKHHHSVMTLPLMGKEVAPSIEYGGSKQNWAALALYLLDRGFITEKDKGDAVALANVGIKKWLKKYAKDIEFYKFHIDVTPTIDDNGFSYVNQESIEENNPDIYMMFGAGEGLAGFDLVEKMTTLEESIPGLGQTVYYWLVTEAARNFDVYSPWMGRDLASNVWWMGMDTQKDWLSEVELNGEELEEGSTPSPNDWDAAFPEWVNNIKSVFTKAQIKKIAKTHQDAFIKDVCESLLEIIDSEDAYMPDLSGTEYYRAYSGLYLFWGGENDISKRLMDDFMQDVNNSGDSYSEFLGLTKIPNNQEDIDMSFKQLEAGLKQMRNLERLIKLVGAQIY